MTPSVSIEGALKCASFCLDCPTPFLNPVSGFVSFIISSFPKGQL